MVMTEEEYLELEDQEALLDEEYDHAAYYERIEADCIGDDDWDEDEDWDGPEGEPLRFAEDEYY